MASDMRDLLHTLAARIANGVARAVVQVVNDATMLQLLQLGVLADEDADDCERIGQYGFFSVPLVGAEAVVVFPNGDRGIPLVVAVDDRRYRPKNGQAGESGIYNNADCVIRLTKDGDITVTCKAGRTVTINDGSGGEALITKSQYDVHTHATGVGPSGPPSNAATSGTTVTRGK